MSEGTRDKRTNGEGSITKRGNTYQGRITVTLDGERQTIRFTKPTRREAVDELRAIQFGVSRRDA